MPDDSVSRSLTFTGRIRSFRYAFHGIAIMLRSQQNAWIHATATIAALIAGVLLGISRAEWCWIGLAIVAVWTAEALNTALEFLIDVASPEFHPIAGQAKDVAAGAVPSRPSARRSSGALVFGPASWHLRLDRRTGCRLRACARELAARIPAARRPRWRRATTDVSRGRGAFAGSRRRPDRKGFAMCRNIKTLHNFKPPATDEEIRASALQFVRKLSGFTRPSR
jgi:diacylglycerol kinase (ATP)